MDEFLFSLNTCMYLRQKYRIYPNRSQEQLLIQWLGQARFVWNHMLSVDQEKYTKEKKFIFKIEMNNLLPELKKTHIWLKEIPSQSLQQKCGDLDKALKGSFRQKKGFPKYKSRQSDTSGISFPQGWKITDKLYLPKIKEGIKFKQDRTLLGKAKTCTIYKNKANQWFVSIVVQVEDSFLPPLKEEIKEVVGLDVGIKEFLTTSDGEVISNPRFLKKKLKKLKLLQRRHSKTKKGSKNRDKKRIKVARLHNKISNQRKDFIKKSANSIAKNYDLICIEDLQVKNMVKNHKLAQAINDVSWSMFFDELKWQCQKTGSHLVRIDKFYPSSKTCSSCGNKKETLGLEERTYSCESCGYEQDRDVNAAINIQKQGIEIFQKNTVGTTEIHACSVMIPVRESGQETCCSSDCK